MSGPDVLGSGPERVGGPRVRPLVRRRPAAGGPARSPGPCWSAARGGAARRPVHCRTPAARPAAPGCRRPRPYDAGRVHRRARRRRPVGVRAARPVLRSGAGRRQCATGGPTQRGRWRLDRGAAAHRHAGRPAGMAPSSSSPATTSSPFWTSRPAAATYVGTEGGEDRPVRPLRSGLAGAREVPPGAIVDIGLCESCLGPGHPARARAAGRLRPLATQPRLGPNTWRSARSPRAATRSGCSAPPSAAAWSAR